MFVETVINRAISPYSYERTVITTCNKAEILYALWTYGHLLFLLLSLLLLLFCLLFVHSDSHQT